MILNKKNKLLILGFILSLFVSYHFAISKTIAYYQEYQQKKDLISQDDSNPKLALQLKLREKQLDQILQQYKISNSNTFQNDLLKELNVLSGFYHLKIIDFKEPHTITQNQTTTSSYMFSLEGSYNGCLALINKIENNSSLGSIKHLHFIKKRDYKLNRDFLIVEVILCRSKEN